MDGRFPSYQSPPAAVMRALGVEAAADGEAAFAEVLRQQALRAVKPRPRPVEEPPMRRRLRK